jgi:hypothetical protein
MGEIYATILTLAVLLTVGAGLWGNAIFGKEDEFSIYYGTSAADHNYVGPILLAAVGTWMAFFTIMHAVVRSAVKSAR